MLKTNLKDVNFSFEQFLLEINNLLGIHAPFKYSKRNDKKRNTNGIANSTRKKNNLYKKLCRAKDSERKEELHKLYKAYKNHETNLSRRSKESYFKNLFEENKKNTYKIWQEIKVLIDINTQTKYAPIRLHIKDSIVTDNKVIANEFNNLFNSIATKIDSKIIHTKTTFQDTLKNPNEKSFFIHPTTKEEIEDNIKLLNDHKTTGPNSIPTQILKQFKKTLSEPLNNLINLSFTTGVFPNIAKIAKIVPLYKKVINWNVITIDLSLCFRILGNLLKNYSTKGCISFSIKANVCLIHNLAFDHIIQQIML